MRRLTGFGLLAPALVLIAAVFVAPLALLGRYSLNAFVPGSFMVDAVTLANYRAVATDPYYLKVLATTVLMAAGITLLSLLLGFPLARLISKARRGKKWLILAVILPLFVGNTVRAAGWMVAFGQQGLLNWLLRAVGVIEHPLNIMYTPWAVLIGATAVNLPFVVLTIQSVLDGVEPALEEASASLGSSKVATFMHVTLPLAMPGVIAAAILSFILGMNAYATPILLGGPGFQMMAPAIATEILSKSNWPLGGALSFVLLGITIGLTSMMARVRRPGHA